MQQAGTDIDLVSAEEVEIHIYPVMSITEYLRYVKY
jgi:hypothetical protein